MTLCRRGRSVFSLTLVRGLVAILLIGGAALGNARWTGTLCYFCTFAAFRSIRGMACVPPSIVPRSGDSRRGGRQRGQRSYPSVPGRRRGGGRRRARSVPAAVVHVSQAGGRRLPLPPRAQRHPALN